MDMALPEDEEYIYDYKGATSTMTRRFLRDCQEFSGVNPLVLIRSYIDYRLAVEGKDAGDFSVIAKISKDVSDNEFTTHIKIIGIPKRP